MDQAYEVYRLPPGHENNFDCLKNALLKRYELTASAYRYKFCGTRREKGETRPIYHQAGNISEELGKIGCVYSYI